LHGGDGADRLVGGAGADDVDGGSGKDTLLGGPGADRLAPDDAAGGFADVVDGGAAGDFVDYSMRHDDLKVDLARAGTVQGAGEGDSFTSVEGVIGGSGDDVLLGHAGRDQLNGGPGRDRIDGRGGNDVIEVLDGLPDRVACGSGSDVVAGRVPGLGGGRTSTTRVPDATDFLATDCESVWVGAKPKPVHLRRVHSGVAVFARPCEKAGDRFSLRIDTSSRLVGATRTIRCDAAGGTVRVKLRGLRRGMRVTLHWRIGSTAVAWRTALL
jgi:Ca2+-binding RTX toxin-like protein